MTENPNKEALTALNERYSQVLSNLFLKEGIIFPKGVDLLTNAHGYTPYLSVDSSNGFPFVVLPTYLGAVINNFFGGDPYELNGLSLVANEIVLVATTKDGVQDLELALDPSDCSVRMEDTGLSGSEVNSSNELRLMEDLLSVIDQIPQDKFKIGGI